MSGSRKSASALLVDIGNTRIKWALWHAGRLGRAQAEVYGGWSSKDFARHLFGPTRNVFGQDGATRARVPGRIVVASVAGESVLRRLAAAARRAKRTGAGTPSIGPASTIIPELIATSRRAAGVVTRYREPWRLGVDRFLGVIAAHHLAGSRGACVINAGTAVTLDLVDGHGVHWGGAILPGPRLMVESLLQRTAGIARRARSGRRLRAASRASGSSDSQSFFARDTAAAIEQGAAHAVAGAVERAIASSRRHLGDVAPLVILTGGDAAELRRFLPVRCTEVPDLVLRGIALHAGLALR
ncbi:MAG: type III pantothenate kinase [Steroidobacteraceae bacterium]